MHSSLGICRAYETGCFWIQVNPLHPRTIGHSTICGPSKVLAETTIGKSEIIYANLDWNDVQEFRDYMNLEKHDYFSPRMPKIIR